MLTCESDSSKVDWKILVGRLPLHHLVEYCTIITYILILKFIMRTMMIKTMIIMVRVMIMKTSSHES